jgi:hypothetical protein
MEKKMKKVIVFSSEKVFYRTEMEVPEGASDDEISQMFFDIYGMDPTKELESYDSLNWRIDEIVPAEEA